MSKRVILLLVFCCVAGLHKPLAQPFAADIAAFKKADAAKFPPKNAILFVGSSSFTMWTDVQDYFPSFTVINRGFGGSSLADLIYYAKDIIIPYRPKQVIIYCGENDFAGDESLPAKTIAGRFYTLFSFIRKRYADMPVAYVSMKPSPSRRHLMPKFDSANRMIRHYLSKRKNTAFINVYRKMLNASGEPRPEIFLDDSLHMNKRGYAIWASAIKPYLIK